MRFYQQRTQKTLHRKRRQTEAEKFTPVSRKENKNQKPPPSSGKKSTTCFLSAAFFRPIGWKGMHRDSDARGRPERDEWEPSPWQPRHVKAALILNPRTPLAFPDTRREWHRHSDPRRIVPEGMGPSGTGHTPKWQRSHERPGIFRSRRPRQNRSQKRFGKPCRDWSRAVRDQLSKRPDPRSTCNIVVVYLSPTVPTRRMKFTRWSVGCVFAHSNVMTCHIHEMQSELSNLLNPETTYDWLCV